MSGENFSPADGKDHTFPRFYTRAVENPFQSEQQGRPVFDDLEYVEITIGGDTRTTVDRAVKDEDKHRWPKIYEAFKRGEESAATGTPLEQWAMVTAGQVRELKALNVMSVEMLAGVSDAAMQRFMGARALKEKAIAWLAQAADGAAASQWVAEKASMQSQLDVLQGQINELIAMKTPTKETANAGL